MRSSIHPPYPGLLAYLRLYFVIICSCAHVVLSSRVNASAASGARCSTIDSCEACVKEKAAGCIFDYALGSCCKKGRGADRCSSALTVNSVAGCGEYNLASIYKQARRDLGYRHAEDLELCREALKPPGIDDVDDDSVDMSFDSAFHSRSTQPRRQSTAGWLLEAATSVVKNALSNATAVVSLADMASCVSAMLRRAIYQDLLPNTPELSQQHCNLEDQKDPRKLAPVCCMLKGSPLSKGDVHACGVHMPVASAPNRVSKSKVPVQRGFRALRRLEPGVEDRIRSAIMAGPLRAQKFTAGKSKSSFLTTADGSFLLKAVRHDSQDEDRSLIKLLLGYKDRQPLVDYLKKRKGKSLLNLIYGMYSVQFMGYNEVFILMEDASMGLGHQPLCQTRTYDLKGASRADEDSDKANETKKEKMNVEFRVFEGNHFGLSPRQCSVLREAMHADGQFLEEHHQIDYSIYARYGSGKGCKLRCRPGSEASCWIATRDHRRKGARIVRALRRLVPRRSSQEDSSEQGSVSSEYLTISVLDYLNKYNAMKKGESIIGRGKFDEYATKMDEFMARACPADDNLGTESTESSDDGLTQPLTRI